MAQGVFVYAPDIQVVIANPDGTAYDLSRDIQDFSIRRSANQVSSFSATLNNKWQKYDRKLNRMARIVVLLRRVNWLQVFSGYLDTVPYETVVPGAVTIGASCTLKIIENTWWNSHTQQAEKLMPGVSSVTPAPEGTAYQDGGAGQAIFNVLTQVCHWPPKGIHIQKIPQGFLNYATKVNQLAPDQVALDVLSKYMSSGVTAGAASDGAPGGYNVTPAFQVKPFTSEQLYALPAQRGYCSEFGGPGGGAYNNMALTGEPGSIPDSQRQQWGGPYYCAMRWQPVTNASYGWWKNQRLLITAVDKPMNAVVVRPADWGPGSGGVKALASADSRAIDLSSGAYSYLGVGNGEVTIQMVDPSSPCGPVQPKSGQGVSSVSTTAHLSIAGGVTGEMVAATRVDKNGVANGLLPGAIAMAYWINSLCIKNNIDYVITSGWRTHSLSETSNIDYHMRGLALDVSAPGNNQDQINKLWKVLQSYAAKGDFAELFLGGTTLTWYGATFNPHGYLDNPNHIHMASANPNSFEGVTIDGQGVAAITAAAAASTADQGATQVANQAGTPNNQQLMLGGIAATGGSPFVIDMQNFVTADDEASLLTGPRNFIDDEQLLATIQSLSQAAMRQFQSAPNGDFIAWFPDKFGLWGQTPAMTIRDIEIKSFSISVSDTQLVTHVATAGETQEIANSPTLNDWIVTNGIVSVERPEVMKLLMGIDPSSNVPAVDSVHLLSTFGIRPIVQPIPQIRSPLWELWTAMQLFMEKWSAQWSTSVELTFMPELYPGMLVDVVSERIREKQFQMYVEAVSHQGSRTGGFTTTAQLSCPTQNGKLLEFNDYGGDLSAPATNVNPNAPKVPGLGVKFL